MSKIKIAILIIGGFIVLSLVGLGFLGYYAEKAGKEAQAFSVIGEITEIQNNLIKIKIFQEENSALEQTNIIIRVDQSTKYIKRTMPNFIYEPAPNLSGLIKEEEGQFSYLQIGDKIFASSLENIINKKEFTAKTIIKNYVD